MNRKQPLTDGPFLAVAPSLKAQLRFHAFLNNPGRDEKEFKASNPERLREFIEAYWLDGPIPEDAWKRMFENGDAIHFPKSGTVHIEIDGV